VLQQCTGKVVTLNIEFEITYSTTVAEFNTAMTLVVLMGDIISSVRVLRQKTLQKQRDIALYTQFTKGVRTYIA
jgi:hypothetical protein